MSPRPAPTPTYRVQLNAGFTFNDARGLVPYLDELGIGTLYTSPFLRATPGSTHGYDVTDYASLNPEIGSDEDFSRLADTLREHGMGLVVDVVPNHMGIAQGANAWWQDVLENGRTSPYATYFDIDWRPLKDELRGKILLPVLGDPYGVVLERGELTLERHGGEFSVRYFETPFPIAPPTYPMILTRVLERLPSPDGAGEELVSDSHGQPLDARLELQSIITAFERLPGQQETDPERIAERRREQLVAKHRMATLLDAAPEAARALEGTLRELNGKPGDPSSFDALDRLLDAQSYRLSSFRTAGEEINYRRFFAINELAAVRQEAAEVFAAAHERLLGLIATGTATGLRIDHPDGLWDPAGYFRDLQSAAWRALREHEPDTFRELDLETIAAGAEQGGSALADRLPVYVVVEKILEPGEALPDDWLVHGTVGYEFARATTGLFVNGEHRRAFDALYGRFTRERRSFEAIAYEAKDLILRTALASELNVLARGLNRISEQSRRTRDFTLSTLRAALRTVITSFPIYRTYIACERPGVSPHDRQAIERAVARARRHAPEIDPSVFDFLAGVLLLHDDGALADDERRERCQFVMKFQQLSGPVMAKGVEDTAFYRYHRLIALNEVGGDPAAFGVEPAEFHRQNAERARRWPDAMLTSSTHDTKRSEDVRARIAVLSELPQEWRAAITRWARLNRRHKTRLEGQPAPDRNDEYLFYQTLLGVWPWGAETLDADVRKRIEATMLKAAREAQTHTSWINQNAAYEDALTAFVRAALDDTRRNPFLEDVAPLREAVAHFGAINALSQQLLKLTAPGVPDLYQGTELWDQSLVDPDNRRPVDYTERASLLRALNRCRPGPRLASELLTAKANGRIKLFLTARALACRRAHPALFARGEYMPLQTSGPTAEHVIAFARVDATHEAIVAVPRLVGGLTAGQLVDPVGPGIWGESRLVIPDAAPGTRYTDVMTIQTLQVSADQGAPGLWLRDVFARLPFVLLMRGREPDEAQRD